MFCIQQDSEVQSLADVAEEVGNVIIPVRSCTDLVFIARSKSYKIALHRNTLNVPTVVLEQQQSITMETEMLPVHVLILIKHKQHHGVWIHEKCSLLEVIFQFYLPMSAVYVIFCVLECRQGR